MHPCALRLRAPCGCGPSANLLHATTNARLLLQVVHCRRVLKWTYAIAYYTFEETVSGSPLSSDPLNLLIL